MLTEEERDALLWVAYLLGDIVTFLYLALRVVGVADWWQGPLGLLFSFLIAQAWPLYWVVLRWL